MKTIFTQNNVVIGHATKVSDSITVSSGTDSESYCVPDNSPVDVGWTVSITNGEPVFTAPTTLPQLTAIQLYDALTPAEETAILGSTDPIVQTFARRLSRALSTGSMIDPNLNTVQEGLVYLSETDQQPTTTPPSTYILPSRVEQILSGIPQ